MHYSKDTIDNVTAFIEKKTPASFNFLITNNHKAWLLFLEAVFVSDDAFKKLIALKQPFLAALVKAIEGEKPSVEFLLKNKAPHLAALANIVNRDSTAEKWLKQNNMEHYIKLAEAIRKKLDDESESDFSYLFKGPF